MAGWIDIIGFEIFVKENTSFMTGRLMVLGIHLYNKNLLLFIQVLAILLFFVIGSYISSLITIRFGLEGGLLLSSLFLLLALLPIKILALILFPLALGAQNAATSISLICRTSHFSGILTDLGIYLAKKDWSKFRFYLLRLPALPIGVLFGYSLLPFLNKNLLLLIPALTILAIGILQKFYLKIPLK